MLRAWKVALARGGEHAFPGMRNLPALEEEMRYLRAENKWLTMERDISKNTTALRPGVVLRDDFVERHRDRWPVRLMCRVLCDSPGGYDDWRGRPRSNRAARQDALVVAIKAVHGELKARYGSPRIHAKLVARGETWCVNTVVRLMRREGPAARTRRKFRCTSDSNHGRPVAENGLGHQFEPNAPNRAWTTGLAYIATAEDWLDLAAMEALYSRKIVGWSMGSRINSRLVDDALEMELAGRRPGAGGSFGPGEPVHQQELPAPHPRL